MGKHFISSSHKERFISMMIEDNMSPSDSERASLFYIITGNDDLYRKRRFIYDPSEHCIRDCLDDANVDFSSGMRSLIRLGFNLYNGWSDRYTTPMSLLGSLDSRNLVLAGNAIMIRFNRSLPEELVD
jgi:hypothetical protein